MNATKLGACCAAILLASSMYGGLTPRRYYSLIAAGPDVNPNMLPAPCLSIQGGEANGKTYYQGDSLDHLPTRDGFEFNGYWTEPDGRGVMVINPNGILVCQTVDGSHMTVYSDWILTAEPLNVIHFDMMGGSNSVESVTATTGDIMPSVRPPICEGKAFVGYYDSDGILYLDRYANGKVVIKPLGDIYLTARWTDAHSGEWLQAQVDSAPTGTTTTIVLDLPVMAFRRPIVIPAGKDIIIDLNGYWIDRCLLLAEPVEEGEVIKVFGHLEMTSSAEVTMQYGNEIIGGNSKSNGGGILIAKKGSLILRAETRVWYNASSGMGGGVYGEKYSALFLEKTSSVAGNKAKRGCDIEIPCGTFRFCSDAEHAETESDVRPYSPGLMLLLR